MDSDNPGSLGAPVIGGQNLIGSMGPLPSLEGENMFESQQPASKSNLATLAAVVIIVLVLLLAATWFFTRA